MLKLRLRGPAKVVEWSDIDPATKMLDFQQRLAEEFQIPIENQKILFGFPPKEIEFLSDEAISSKVANNETLIIQQRTAPTAPSNEEEVPAKREKRKRTQKSQASSASTASRSDDGPNIHTLHSSSAPKAPSKRGAKPPTKRQKTTVTPWNVKDKGEDFIDSLEKSRKILEEAIATAVSTRRRSGEDASLEIIRQAAKDALREREEETLANKRYEASLSGEYEIEFPDVHRLGDDFQPILKVKFKTGPRSWTEEVHPAFTPEELKGIIAIVLVEAGAELLKPYKMALVSPRVFWSLVHHFQDISAGLHSLFPTGDWSFINSRKRELSEKAKELERNKEFYEQLDRELGEDVPMDTDNSGEYVESKRRTKKQKEEANTTANDAPKNLESTAINAEKASDGQENPQTQTETDAPFWLKNKEMPLLLTWHPS